MSKVIALIATRPNVDVLLKEALPSVISQQRQPDALVVVSDSRLFTSSEYYQIESFVESIPLFVLKNSRVSGAAGSWNTGINFIQNQFGDCYTAILDDDDQWEDSHLYQCELTGDQSSADVVISGINTIIDRSLVDSKIPFNVSLCDFLIGNPGWQGSNTFVRNTVLQKVGFTDGLVSSNDKDLAIKILSNPSFTFAYTSQVTVNWICGESLDALSARESPQKLKGCAQFLKLHQHRMTAEQLALYFKRTEKLFGFNKQDILKENSRLI